MSQESLGSTADAALPTGEGQGMNARKVQVHRKSEGMNVQCRGELGKSCRARRKMRGGEIVRTLRIVREQ